jgi:hypothetical protein
MRDACKSSGTGETPQAKPRILTALLAASEYPGAENCPYFKNNNVCENI